MHRLWICLLIALALAAPSAYAGKLDSVEQAAKTYIAKKEISPSGAHSISDHSLAGNNSHGKASQIVSKGKKLLGK